MRKAKKVPSDQGPQEILAVPGGEIRIIKIH